MINIITAISNPILNNNLKKEKDINILINDIQYQEGILEALEKIKNIDFIILTELLPGELEIKNLINKIKLKNKQIQIILILEKTKEINNKNIDYILYQENTNIKEIIEIIKNNSSKKKIMQKENIQKEIIKNNKTLDLNKLRIAKKEMKKKQKAELISIIGTNGIGKSIITINIAKTMMLSQNKILIIDFDILNNSLHTILGVNKYSSKIKEKIKEHNKIKIEELIIKVNKKIDLISGIDIVLNIKEIKQNKTQLKILEEIIEKLKNKYNIILFDTSFECFLEINKFLTQMSDKNIFVTGTNLLEIKKAKNLLDIYINYWKIEKEKISILFNKYSEETIDLNILKKIFEEFNIIGELKYNKNYEKMINKHNLNDKEIEKEYLKINTKI